MMDTKRILGGSPLRAFLATWVLVQAALGAAGPATLKLLEGTYLYGSATRAADGPRAVLGVTIGFVLLVSVAQWLMLARYLEIGPLWPLATLIGAALTIFVFIPLATFGDRYQETFRSDLLLFAGSGAILGVVQWPVLRRALPSASWWVPTSTLGGAAIWLSYTLVAQSAPLGAAVARGVESQAILAVAAQGGVSVAAYALMTGIVLSLLSRRPIAPPPQPLRPVVVDA